MLIAESPFPDIQLGGGYTQIIKNAINPGNSPVFQFVPQIAKIVVYQGHFGQMVSQNVFCMPDRFEILIKGNKPSLIGQP
jgi:hypothetical protein